MAEGHSRENLAAIDRPDLKVLLEQALCLVPALCLALNLFEVLQLFEELAPAHLLLFLAPDSVL